MELSYRKAGNILIPDFEEIPQPEGRIGRYGRMREEYLYEEKPTTYSMMSIEGSLKQHLLEIEAQAQEMKESLTDRMKNQRGITEQMKAQNREDWVKEMEAIQREAESIVVRELIRN